jgi:hypothetical protein
VGRQRANGNWYMASYEVARPHHDQCQPRFGHPREHGAVRGVQVLYDLHGDQVAAILQKRTEKLVVATNIRARVPEAQAPVRCPVTLAVRSLTKTSLSLGRR